MYLGVHSNHGLETWFLHPNPGLIMMWDLGFCRLGQRFLLPMTRGLRANSWTDGLERLSHLIDENNHDLLMISLAIQRPRQGRVRGRSGARRQIWFVGAVTLPLDSFRWANRTFTPESLWYKQKVFAGKVLILCVARYPI